MSRQVHTHGNGLNSCQLPVHSVALEPIHIFFTTSKQKYEDSSLPPLKKQRIIQCMIAKNLHDTMKALEDKK